MLGAVTSPQKPHPLPNLMWEVGDSSPSLLPLDRVPSLEQRQSRITQDQPLILCTMWLVHPLRATLVTLTGPQTFPWTFPAGPEPGIQDLCLASPVPPPLPGVHPRDLRLGR